MKKNVVVLAALLLSVSISAQVQTLVNSDFTSGGYGGPVFKVGLFSGNAGIMSGGRGAWVINQRIGIGGGGYSTLYDVGTGKLSSNNKQLFTDLNYGGFELEYYHNVSDLIHWTIQATIGAGTVKLLEHGPNLVIGKDNIFLLEPSFNAEVNILPWFRIGLGAGYRATMGLNIDGISTSDLNGPSGQITFKFGIF